ncbi:MAG: hypothetical protein M1276_00645 [Deltaproteobacteria bacterium]|jgi:hypothetical protein|nr:hypothetical protein [Deltaproteobacteria bacterium]
MDKEKDKEQKTVKKDYGSKKRTAAEEKEQESIRKAAETLKVFLRDNIID